MQTPAAAKMRELAEGGYLERAEPVLFIGECGTGKTHLLTGLCVAACRQKRRVRFATAARRRPSGQIREVYRRQIESFPKKQAATEVQHNAPALQLPHELSGAWGSYTSSPSRPRNSPVSIGLQFN
jgi:hypothetical protein